MQNIPPEAAPIVARYERNACTPRMVAEIMRSNIEIDVRSALPAISVPTLVLHAQGDPVVPVELGRWLAEHIPSAEFVELPGAFHGDWNTEGLFPEAAAFLAGDAPPSATNRMLATVLFTDIVSSTETDVRVGDHRWRELLDRHDDVAKRRIARHRGRLVKTTGDGLWQRLMVRLARSRVRKRSHWAPSRWGSTSGRGCTPERWSCAVTTSPASVS